MNTFHKIIFHPAAKALRIGQFILALIIFYYAALMPPNDEPSSIPAWLYHLTGNILLIGSAYTAFLGKLSLKLIFAACMPLSILAEGAQNFSAQRFSNWEDVATNIAGLLIGLMICYFVSRALQLEK